MIDNIDPSDPEKEKEYKKLQSEEMMSRYMKRQQEYKKIIERDCYGYKKAKIR